MSCASRRAGGFAGERRRVLRSPHSFPSLAAAEEGRFLDLDRGSMAEGTRDEPGAAKGPLDILLRADVLSGLMFTGVGILGLYLARNLDVGTAMKMGTAYVPRLCCFALIGLGLVILAGGLMQSGAPRIGAREPISWRSLVLVPAAVFAFGFTIERIGLVLAILLAVGIAGTAAAGQRPVAVAVSGAFLALLCTAIFVWGLGLPFSIWLPDN